MRLEGYIVILNVHNINGYPFYRLQIRHDLKQNLIRPSMIHSERYFDAFISLYPLLF